MLARFTFQNVHSTQVVRCQTMTKRYCPQSLQWISKPPAGEQCDDLHRSHKKWFQRGCSPPRRVWRSYLPCGSTRTTNCSHFHWSTNGHTRRVKQRQDPPDIMEPERPPDKPNLRFEPETIRQGVATGNGAAVVENRTSLKR